MSTVRYGKSRAIARPAAGIKGFLLRGVDGKYFFRVYRDAGEFIDYELRHDDLEVTVSVDALASFYEIGERRILDHSPEVLGLETISGET
ncbi:MAG TPA: hypothetical protein VFR86_24540 [Burkholderiaceae bacterium]|nr:hypothetical protein [Burkholderiaceae bacterium]